MKLISAIAGGAAGAVVLTLLHETTRRLRNDAPRMDLMGMEAIEKSLEEVNVEVPKQRTLFNITMAGDLLSNSLYYSVAGLGGAKWSFPCGAALGLAAGLGAVYLPKHIGLNPAPSNRTPQTKLMTTALYLAGGLVAGAVSKLLNDGERDAEIDTTPTE